MHIHQNVPGILRAINDILGDRGINIERQVLDTRGKTSTITSLAAIPANVSLASSTQLIATVKAASGTALPVGTISFELAGTPLGQPVDMFPVSGVPTAGLEVTALTFRAPGNYTITAVYSGDQTFSGSTATTTISVIGASISNLRVSTVAPPQTGCPAFPPALTSFLTTDNNVYLWFNTNTSSVDNLTSDWIAPNGTVVPGNAWAAQTGTFCDYGPRLNISNLPTSQLGTWEARIYDNKSLIAAVSFTINAPPPVGWFSLGGSFSGKVAVTRNNDGRIEALVRSTDGSVGDVAQLAGGGPWGAFKSLGGVVTGTPAIASNTSGRLESVARAPDNSVWSNEQASAGGPWGGWVGPGGQTIADPAIGVNLSGDLEIFVLGTDSALWHVGQTSPSGTWGSWQYLGGGLTSAPVVGRNKDGRLEVFMRGEDSSLWHIWQTSPGGSWSAWAPLGGIIKGTPTVAANSDGRLQVFVLGSDNGLWYISQLTVGSSGWAAWNSLGGIATADPAAVVNADGRLEAFVRGIDNALWHRWQTAPGGSWSDWATEGGTLGSAPNAVLDSAGRLVVLAQGSGPNLVGISQHSPGVWH